MSYRIRKEYAGLYYIFNNDDGECVARVGKFNPGPMVSVTGPSIASPALAKAMATAMTRVANELEKETK